MDHESTLEIARAVSPKAACRYLAAKGWTKANTGPREDIYLFGHKKYKYEQIIVPKSNDYERYADDILVAVGRLTEVERRSEDAILSQLKTPDADTLRYRLISPNASLGTISLGLALQFIKSITESLAASVCDCANKKLFHPNLGLKQVKRLLDKAQFGQTEQGSFVVKVVAPLDNLESNSVEFTEMLDGGIRGGITHLMNSASVLVQTIEKGQVKPFIKKGLSCPPFSSNLIRSLVRMQIWDDASVEISSDWSPVLKADRKTPSKVMIESDYFKEIASIGVAFSPKENEERTDYFTGVVSDLGGDHVDENNNRYGEVVVQALATSGESFPVKLDLPQEQYKIADQSHMQNIPIIFSGKLVRKIRAIDEIRDIGMFKLLAEAGAEEED